MNEQTGDRASVGKLVQDFKVVLQDAESLLRSTASNVGDKAQDARARLATSLEHAKAQFQEFEERARVSARLADEKIREHPYESVGVAFGVGLLFGILVGRR